MREKRAGKKRKEKNPLWLKITILSFVILLIFRFFNKPYFFGKSLLPLLNLIAQIISGMIILSIILGLYFRKIWAWWLAIIDIALGFINHLSVAIIYIIKPNIIDPFLISQNPTLNKIISIFFPIISLYWLFLAYLLYINKKLFK